MNYSILFFKAQSLLSKVSIWFKICRQKALQIQIGWELQTDPNYTEIPLINGDIITPDSSSSLASRTVPEFWRFLQTQNRERQKGLGKKEGLGKKSCDFLVSQGVCLLFLMGEFKHDLEEFHQKLVQTKLVPVPETNAAGKKAHHNSIPQHPSTVQQPADEPAGTRNDPFKGIKISMEPVILF